MLAGAALRCSAYRRPLRKGLRRRRPAPRLNKYCATCHNRKVKTGGLAIDPADAGHPERACRELGEGDPQAAHRQRCRPRARRGPTRPPTTRWRHSSKPSSIARPPRKPNPGKLPLLHRLSRTEYQNAIRDLLALDAMPKEMDYSLLLPPDNASSGFDNLADLLFVSPTAMERYLDAAEKISRLAVGDPAAPVMVNIYNLPDEQPQTGRVDELPFGTRGGVAIRSHFPLDGEYTFKVELAAPSAEPGAARNYRRWRAGAARHHRARRGQRHKALRGGRARDRARPVGLRRSRSNFACR